MRSKYLLLFSVGLLLIISTFVLAQNKEKLPPQAKQKTDKSEEVRKNDQSDRSDKDKDKNSNIKKGNDQRDVRIDQRDKNEIRVKEYRKGNKVVICHKESNEPVTIEINENALDAHMAHGDTRGECIYTDTGEPDKFIKERREVRSNFYSTVVEAEDLIDITNRRIETARQKVELATQRLTTLRSQPDVDEEEIREKEEAINRVQQLVQEMEQQISYTRLKLQRDRQIIGNLRID